MRKKILYVLLFGIYLNGIVFSQHTNVLISNKNAPNEPSIAINPKNTNHLIAGANINNYYYSTDGGLTWSDSTATSTYGVWGDPCMVVDTAGDYYFFHLSNPSFGSWIDRIVCQKTSTLGGPWSNGTFLGLNGTKAQDKEWVAVDPRNNTMYITWSQFDVYGSANTSDSSLILFSKSTDAGNTWSAALRLSQQGGDCIDSDSTVEGATPAIGPNGEVYVSWVGANGIMFDKSIDSGTTWLNNDAPVVNVPGGWNYIIPGLSRCNGLPVTACDLSNSPNRGTIYINWSDQRNGATDTDVWLVKSTDGGTNWSNPIRVNDDPAGKQQFFSWMTIDQTNGYLYFVFYDRRNYSDNNTDVYMAVSKDGGQTFDNFKVSTSPFLPFSNVFFGDYTNITAHNGVVRPIWTALNNGQLSIWTALIDTTALGVDNETNIPFSLEQNYPNPFSETTHISFKIHTNTSITLKVLDLYGREVASLANDKVYPYGKHVESFDAKKYNLPSGIYYFSLVSQEHNLVKKMILVQ